jgi:hypothetical protein
MGGWSDAEQRHHTAGEAVTRGFWLQAETARLLRRSEALIARARQLADVCEANRAGDEPSAA